MALPTNNLYASQINTELGRSATQQMGLAETAVRNLAQRPSGEIAFSHLLGKSNIKLAVTVGCGYAAESLDSKGPTPERRGFHSADFYGVAIGSRSPASIAGHTIWGIVEESSQSYENRSSFKIAVVGHAIPVNYFTRALVVGVREFPATNGLRTSTVDRNATAVNITVWTWTLSVGARGQIFPTSGSRTVHLM